MGKSESRSNNKSDLALTWRQWLQIGVVALLVLGGSGYVGWRWLQSWRYDKAIRDTQDYMRLGDPRSAAFAAKRAAQVRGDSVEAARMLAEALEQTGSVEAVIWRKKVVDLAPGDFRDHIAFAASAMRFRDPNLARTALEKVDAAGREHIDYHRTAADIAMALGDNAVAETHLVEIARLDPYDSERRMKLAILRLALSAASSITEAKLNDDPRLAGLAEELLGEENATLDDCLMCFEVLRQMRGTEVVEKLGRLETAKFHNPADLGDAMLWLTGRSQSARTIAWAEKLGEELRTTPEVQFAIADAYIFQKEWGLVLAVVEETEWGDFEAERLAMSAIGWRISGDAQRSDASWNLAELRLQQDATRIRRLADFCVRWGVEPEKEKLWWKLASCSGDQTTVLQRLFTLSMQRKDGAGLYRAVKGLYLAKPDDAPSMNNYAWLSLLRNEDLEKAHQLADRVFAVDPKVGAYASTYAYSMHLRGRTEEGLKALEAAPAHNLQDATVAGCYGYLLAATGNVEKAQAFLGAARRSPDLLPEEARLFLGSRDRIDRSLEVPELRIFSDQP